MDLVPGSIAAISRVAEEKACPEAGMLFLCILRIYVKIKKGIICMLLTLCVIINK